MRKTISLNLDESKKVIGTDKNTILYDQSSRKTFMKCILPKKKSLKIQKGLSEAANIIKTDNAMPNEK